MQQILCSEHLTYYTKKILYHEKCLQRDGLVKYIWTREGIVHTREYDNGPATKIRNELELEQLTENFTRTQNEEEETEIEGASDDPAYDQPYKHKVDEEDTKKET